MRADGNIQGAMKLTRIQTLCWGVALAGASALGSALSAQALPPITVTVNGGAVAFGGAQPVETGGAVLVPLRGVFQALNATVRYDGPTKTIFAQKGSASVVLPLGALTATVNGQPQALSQPAQTVNGTTLVPLRFVAQALGAFVQWHAASSTVEIRTAEPHLASLPPLPGHGPVDGLVTGVYTDTVPQTITVRVNGRNTSVPIGPQTILLRAQEGQPATEVPLGQIMPGDAVHIRRDGQGDIVSVTVTVGQVTGTVKAISRLPNGDAVITLNDGKAVELMPGTPITMGGRHISLSDVLPDEKVVIRTNPASGLGTGVAVVVANNPHPVPPGAAPTVTSFTQDAARPLRAGDVLTATLTGTPGGQASFTVPGVVDRVPMRETAPGVYTGSYTVPQGLAVAGAAVLGRVVVGGVSSPLIQAGQPVTVDSAPPKVTGLSPARDAVVESDRPLIYATLSGAGGADVDTNATRLLLDGTDVTAQATVAPAFVSLKPAAPLAGGRHTVRLTLADAAGNVTTADWAFTVSTARVIRSFTSDAPAGGVAAGTRIRFTLNAAPGGHATVSLGNGVGSVPLAETQPGVYVGAYTVRPGENAASVPAVATFTAPDGTQVTAPLKGDLSLAGGAPAAPAIDSPAEGAQVSDPLTVTGTAAPGATVQVAVTFSGSVLGGLVPVSGAVANTEATADADGRWKATGISLRSGGLLGQGGNTTFTITATAADAAGDTSPATTVHVRRG